ncbi:MAG TPA: hypothetical protein VFU23_00415 [Gemmatimonadales bacterium]|nr:hypothetical protein [Gemmatimonadales bacterium]
MRRGLLIVVAGTIAIGAAYASAFARGGAPRWAAWAMVLGIALTSSGMIVLGATRPGRSSGRAAWAAAFVFVVLTGGFGAALALPPNESAGSVLWLGLPLRAALVLYGVGCLPALVLPLVYARGFREFTLDASDLDRIRAARTADPGS